MAQAVPFVTFKDTPKQNCATAAATQVACGIPLGRLCAVSVSSSSRWQRDAEIYGVVKRQQALKEDDLMRGGYLAEIWLLRLSQGKDGAYHWDDFRPECKLCKAVLSNVQTKLDQPQCPVCKGGKGKGRCFQFDCPESSPLSGFGFGCGKLEPATRPVYCGSHPYFGGYAPGDECFSGTGPPLFEIEFEEFEHGIYSLSVDHMFQRVQADIFVSSEEETFRAMVTESAQSIITPVVVPKCSGFHPVSGALPFHWEHAHEGGTCIHHTYTFVEKSDGGHCILRSVESNPKKWHDWAPVECDDECEFKKQIVKLEGGRLVGLSDKSLWVMEYPTQNIGNPMSAQEMATKISWKKVLTFPGVENVKLDKDKELQDKLIEHGFKVNAKGTVVQFYDGSVEVEWRQGNVALRLEVPKGKVYFEDDFEESPRRLLAAGPKPNQVVIFDSDVDNDDMIRPRLLVELPPSPSDGKYVLATVPLTSIVHIPRQSRNVSEKVLSSGLIPSVIRISGRGSGYLLFNELGQVYHLRDESVILAEHVWVPPDFQQTAAMQRVVVFKFQNHEQGSNARACMMGLLTRYEYFQKLFERWQEGDSAEVNIVDTDPSTFDHLLSFIHSGMVGSHLDLHTLVRLLSLGDKYLMHDLVASTLFRTFHILDDKNSMKQHSVLALADLLIFADSASTSCPTLKRKAIECILCSRGDVVQDADFLARVSLKSAGALASLLAPLAPLEIVHESARKRRKTVSKLQQSLWGDAHRATEAPMWSSIRHPTS